MAWARTTNRTLFFPTEEEEEEEDEEEEEEDEDEDEDKSLIGLRFY